MTPSDLLESGAVDALLSPQLPKCFRDSAPHVARLFPDLHAAEDDYLRRTGIFPVLHIIGIRNELAAANPGLAQNVYRAFVAARNLAPDFSDWHSYGVNERDRKVLNTFLDYHHRQGLSARRYEIAELFAPVPLAAYQA